MAFRVAVSNGGDVVIMTEGEFAGRFDFVPAVAEDFANRVDAQIAKGTSFVFETCQAAQGRAFRYAGDVKSAEQLRDDLRAAAAQARAIAAEIAGQPANDD